MNFREFYYDVLPEFQKFGKVVQFKTCFNKSSHLRGNVYVEYMKEEDAKEAITAFNGRWYAGKQLSCSFSPVVQWKPAVCGNNNFHC